MLCFPKHLEGPMPSKPRSIPQIITGTSVLTPAGPLAGPEELPGGPLGVPRESLGAAWKLSGHPCDCLGGLAVPGYSPDTLLEGHWITKCMNKKLKGSVPGVPHANLVRLFNHHWDARFSIIGLGRHNLPAWARQYVSGNDSAGPCGHCW